MKSRIRSAIQIYHSGGLFVFVRRIIFFFWKEFVWFFIRIRNREQFIKRLIYSNTMYLNLKDTGISKELAVYKTHEPITTTLLRQEIQKGWHVVDIGANIGYYALQEADLVGKDGLVFAIEPAPETLKLLIRNIESNPYKNINLYDVAIGAENGTATMYFSDSTNLSSLQHHSYLNGASTIVKVNTLDNLLANEKRIDFVQMDMEGFEVEAIKGMLQILKIHKPEIFLELHSQQAGPDKAIQLLETLKELGYKSKYTVDKAFNYPYAGNSQHVIETLSIDELITDRRIAKGYSIVNIFFVVPK